MSENYIIGKGEGVSKFEFADGLKNVGYVLQTLQTLLAIDSPSGFTKKVSEYVVSEFKNMGFDAYITKKGGVFCDLGGKLEDNSLLLTGHIDTLGGMVAEVKSNGRLRLTNIGGMKADNAECENALVYTREGKTFEGTFQMNDPSVHVNKEYSSQPRNFDNMELVLDLPTASKEQTCSYGIEIGDFVCFEPRFRITDTGYIKSRFLDDKMSVAVLMGIAKDVSEGNIKLKRKTYIHITVYEEVGHGGSGNVPKDVSEMLVVDMGCVGSLVACKENMVSICAKDSSGPSNYEMTSKLVDLCKREKLDYAVDVYPFYGSDADAALSAGHDLKHCLIGAGVYASHGYERSHIDGVVNTYKLLTAYLEK